MILRASLLLLLLGSACATAEIPSRAAHPASPSSPVGPALPASRTLALDNDGQLFAPSPAEAGAHAGHSHAAGDEIVYVCPMHPDVRSTDKEARCPTCGMRLERVGASP